MVDSAAMRVRAHGAKPAGGQLDKATGRSIARLFTTMHLVVWLQA